MIIWLAKKMNHFSYFLEKKAYRKINRQYPIFQYTPPAPAIDGRKGRNRSLRRYNISFLMRMRKVLLFMDKRKISLSDLEREIKKREG